MLSSTFPYPPTRGGTQVRTFNLLQYLSQRHDITLLTQRSADVTDTEIEQLRQCVKELVVFQKPADSQSGLLGKVQRFTQFLQQGTPPNVLHLYSQEMQECLDQYVQTHKYDVITCEHSVNEIYLRPEWRSQLKTVINIHSSVYATCKHQLETQTSENWFRDQLNLPLLRQYEQRYCSKFDQIVVTTLQDQQQIQAFNPNSQIKIIANGVDLARFPMRSADPGGHKLIFAGAMDNAPNIDAVKFFSLEVFPEIQKRYADVTLELVGARPVSSVLELGKRSGITVLGGVPSMVEYLHNSTICLVPMRTGFGIKNKTLEAMAAGVPVVASDRGLEGLEVDDVGVPLRALRANTKSEYVYAISKLFENAQLREQLSKNARSLIETQYTWERMGSLYEQVLSNEG
ncbi:MAG TPA: glycosyltransferase family 4 protein [Oculatellaceae cyanobacterium]